MGRAIIFKSEAVEHEVRPTLGYDRYAVTVWFNQIIRKPIQPELIGNLPQISDEYSIFVGIPSYRDLQLVETIRSLVSKAKEPKKLRIVIFYLVIKL